MKNAITILIFCMVAIQTASCVKKKLVKVLFVDTTEPSTLKMEDRPPMYRAVPTATAQAEFKKNVKKLTILKDTIVISDTGKTLLKEGGGSVGDHMSDFNYLLKLPTAVMMVYTGPYEKEKEVELLDQKTLVLQVDPITDYKDANDRTARLFAREKVWLEVVPPKTNDSDNTSGGDGSGASSSSTPNTAQRAVKRSRSRAFSLRSSVSLPATSPNYAYENLVLLNNLVLQVV